MDDVDGRRGDELFLSSDKPASSNGGGRVEFFGELRCCGDGEQELLMLSSSPSFTLQFGQLGCGDGK